MASVATAGLVLPLISASGALAFGEPSDFGTCPVAFLSGPTGGGCANTETTGGQITIGKSTVMITNNPDTVDFGFYSANNGDLRAIVLPSNGQMFGGPAQAVPGGTLDLPTSGTTSVTASLELAAPATPEAVLDPTATSYFYNPDAAIGIDSGPALQIPVKVQLHNATLGPSCFIGSNSDPIVLSLSPTAASNPTLSIFDEGNALTLTGLVLGDSAFVAPGASGCGPMGALDGAVDHEIGLPALVGRNDTTLDVNADEASTCYAEGTC